ncbi:MAG: hypothetical protein V9H25_10190 [Candidatus Competibacter sp.]
MSAFRRCARSRAPFAVVTQAPLKAQETAGSDQARYPAKLALARSLSRRGYHRSDILELFRFIDWVLALPEELETRLWADVQRFEEEERIRYVSSFERIAARRGMEKGILRGQAALLGRQLARRRFGPLPEWAEARLKEAEPAQLETWALRVFDTISLEKVFAVGEGH